jgi:hypothetical protein
MSLGLLVFNPICYCLSRMMPRENIVNKNALFAGELVQRRHSTIARKKLPSMFYTFLGLCTWGGRGGEGEADIYIPEEFPISPDTSAQFQAPLIWQSDQN